MANDHIGISGGAMWRGIPGMTLGWTGTAARILTIHNSIDLSAEADVKHSKNNLGQTIEMNRTDKRRKIKFVCKPVSLTTVAADAQAIACDLPQKMDILTITAPSSTNTISNGISTATSTTDTYICDSASAKWTPDGELVVDIEVTVWIGQVFVPFT